jgi:hypothetical protein
MIIIIQVEAAKFLISIRRVSGSIHGPDRDYLD